MKMIDRWLMIPSPLCHDQLPLDYCQDATQRDKLQEVFTQTSFPIYFPIKTLYKRLGLITVDLSSTNSDYEDNTIQYLQAFITQDWEKASQYWLRANSWDTEDLNEYISILTGDRLLKNIRNFNILASALGQTAEEALVHVEINQKQDMTLVWRREGQEWRVKSHIVGPPPLVYGEKSAIEHVIGVLQSGKMDDAEDRVFDYQEIYPDSPDLIYYAGLVQMIKKKPKLAKSLFTRAIMIDPLFDEATYNLAFILQSEKSLEQAKALYHDILTRNQNDLRVLNNLGVVAMMENKADEADRYFKECLRYDPKYEPALKNLELIKEAIERNGSSKR